MKIFITGSTGYIGNRLAGALQKQGEEINILVRDVRSVNLLQGKNITVFKGDITNPESIAAAMKGCTHVYHCAAIAKLSSSETSTFFTVNVKGTENILHTALKTNVQKLIFTSSAAVFGPSRLIPLTENDDRTESFESDYDFSKHLAENLVRNFVTKGLNAVIVNPSRVYGPGPATYSNAVNRTIEKILYKKILLFPQIEKFISNYAYIEDVVAGHLLAMQKGNAGENYILGGENISYRKLLESIINYSAAKNYIIKIPVPLLKRIAAVALAINKKTELTPSLITRFAKNRMLTCTKAIENLGYHITPFIKGIHTTINYLKNNQADTNQLTTKFYQYGKNQISAGTD